MLNEITKISLDGIRAAAADGENITIIINGEYYDLDTTAGTDPEQNFINGVKFAAAVIQDRRARISSSFEGIAQLHRGRTPRKAYAANDARNDEIKDACNFLEYITNTACYLPFFEEYKTGKLWKL